jgi:hypothetical protein
MSGYYHLLADINVNGTDSNDTIIIDFGSLNHYGGAGSYKP